VTLYSESLAAVKKLRAVDSTLESLSNPELKVLVQGVFAAQKKRGSSKYTTKTAMTEFLRDITNLDELIDSLETIPAAPNAPSVVPAVHTAPQTGSRRPPPAPVVTQSPSQPTLNSVDYSTMDADAFTAHMAVAMAEQARRRAATSR
jgi:hypothetical protein